MKPTGGHQSIDIAGSAFCIVVLAYGFFRVVTGEHGGGQESGGLLMLMAGVLGLNAGLRVRARARARRLQAVASRVEP